MGSMISLAKESVRWTSELWEKMNQLSYRQMVLTALTITLSTAVVVNTAKTLQRRRRLQKMYQQFPGPKGHWLTGVAKQLTFDDAYLELIQKWREEYGGIIHLPILWHHYLMVSDPDAMAAIMKTHEPKEINAYRFLIPWMGKGLLVSDGPHWFRMRKLLTPAFHFDILRPYIKVMNECSLVLVDKWKVMCKADASLSVDAYCHVSLLTLDTLLRCIFSNEMNCQNHEKEHPYVKAVYDILPCIIARLTDLENRFDSYFYHTEKGQTFKKAIQICHDFDNNVIQARKKELLMNPDQQLKRKCIDFLDILLSAKDEDGIGLTNLEIRNEVDTFMFEGHDTTASGISWCLFNMAQFPDLQERCRQEVLEVMDGKSEISWADIGKLEYMTMFLKESMRLYPPVPNVARSLTQDFTFPDGRTAPAGTQIFLNIYLVNRNPKFWQNPLRFDPERFSVENSQGRHSHAYLTFSAGPRNCIGQNFAMNEMKITLAHVLANFKLSVDEDRPHSKAELLVLRTKTGLWIKLTPLNHN